MMGQTGQGAEAACAGGHTRATTIRLCHACEYFRSSRGTTPAGRTPAVTTAAGADLGSWLHSGGPLARWRAAEGSWRLEIIKPTPHVQGFVVRPWCWIVERTLGWLGRQRRLSKDYERKVQTSETLLKTRDDPAHGAAPGEEPSVIFKTRSDAANRHGRLTYYDLPLKSDAW